MLEIACFGEALIDLLAEPPAGPGEPWRFRQHAGGAPANTAVAIARLGGSVAFIGRLARDPFGDFLKAELAAAGVRTEGIRQGAKGQTALAFVFLDASGERSFRFYGDRAAHLEFRPDDFPDGVFDTLRLFHFGSNTLTLPESAEVTHDGLRRARDAGAWISMDLNLRPLLWRDAEKMRPAVARVLPQVHILKMSREELSYMAEPRGSPGHWIDSRLEGGSRLVIITDGAGPIAYYTRSGRRTIPAWPVEVRDATAAGDAFSGGLLCRLVEAQREGADPDRWIEAPEALDPALRFAAACGALATTRFGSFGAMPARQEVEAFLAART